MNIDAESLESPNSVVASPESVEQPEFIDEHFSSEDVNFFVDTVGKENSNESNEVAAYAYYLSKAIGSYKGKTLYFYGQENKDLEGEDDVIKYEWANTSSDISEYSFKDAKNCKKVVFDESALTIKPESCHAWFKGFKKCELIEGLDNLDTSDVSNMRDMFAYFACDTKIFPTLDLSNLNTANVVDMSNMFANFATNAQTALPLDLNCWDVSNVRTMSYMFGGFAAKATNAPMLYINKWSTNNVNDMSYMFRDFARESVVPAIIFAGDRFIQYQYGVISDDMFTGSHIRGGAGTTYDPTCVDADSACIDRQLNGIWGKDKGYFTDGSYIGKEFNIFFNAESNLLKDAVVSNKPNSITATFGNTLPAITTGIPTCTDHTFAGFYYVKGSGQSRTETQYYDAAGNPVEGIIWTIPSDATLVAKWQSNRHNIHFNFNAPPKEKATKIPDITVARDTTLPTLKIKPVCKNYDFNGLSYKKNWQRRKSNRKAILRRKWQPCRK